MYEASSPNRLRLMWLKYKHLRASSLVVWLTSTMAPIALVGQSHGGFGLRASQDLVFSVKVRVDNHFDPPDYAPGSGILFGRRGDTLIVVTAYHLIDPPYATVDSIYVQPYPNASLLRAIPAEHSVALDLAVLKVAYSDGLKELYPKGLPRYLQPHESIGYLEPGATLLALGCPRGQCWSSPEDGRVYSVADTLIEFRASAIQNGFSGGPLLDEYGTVLGMIIHDAPPQTAALRWDLVVRQLELWGYVANLPSRQIERRGAILPSALMQGFPLPVKNQRGRHLVPGGRVVAAVRVTRTMDLMFGVAGTSFESTRNVEEPDSTYFLAGNFWLLGLRTSFPRDYSILRGRQPDVFYLEGNYLLENEAIGSQVMRSEVIPDSFDLRTGEPALRKTIRDTSIRGIGLLWGARMYTPAGVALELQFGPMYYTLRDAPAGIHFALNLGVSTALNLGHEHDDSDDSFYLRLRRCSYC